MSQSRSGPFKIEHDRRDFEHIAVPDLATAIRIATERAFELMSAGVASGEVSLNASIVIKDDAGKTVRVVRFRDLIGADSSRFN